MSCDDGRKKFVKHCLILLCLSSWVHLSVSQCGPDGSRPYPPGSSVCPTREEAESMDPHRPPPPQDGGRDGGGGGGGGGMPGIQETPACSNLPCAASLLGDVGKTTVSALKIHVPSPNVASVHFSLGTSRCNRRKCTEKVGY